MARQTWGPEKQSGGKEDRQTHNTHSFRRTKTFQVWQRSGWVSGAWVAQGHQKEPAPQALCTSRYKETVGIDRQG